MDTNIILNPESFPVPIKEIDKAGTTQILIKDYGTGANVTLGSYDFTRVNGDNVSIPSDAVISGFDEAMTIEFWFRLHNITDRQALIQKYDSGGDQRGFLIDYESNKITFIVSEDGEASCNFRFLSNEFAINTWYHLAIVWESDENAIAYLNGVKYNPEQISGDLASAIYDNSSTPLVFGKSIYSSGREVDGNIGDVRIWNTARTEEQIQNNRCVILAGDESGLAGYWKCDNDEGGVAQDSTVNNNDGTITGATTETFTVSSTSQVLTGEETILTTTEPCIIESLTWACNGDSSVEDDVSLNITLDGVVLQSMDSYQYANDTPANIRDKHSPQWEVLEFDGTNYIYCFNLKEVPFYCPEGVTISIKNNGTATVRGWTVRIRGRYVR